MLERVPQKINYEVSTQVMQIQQKWKGFLLVFKSRAHLPLIA